MGAAEPSLDFGVALARTVARAESYGLAVEVEDVTDPNTGDLDGRTILLDHLPSEEEKLFLLLHLFGHCVQWNTPREIPPFTPAVWPRRFAI
ncbi:MAG: hypothetical protein AB7S39_08495 [Gemmatimonadales bacterium]